MIVKIDSHANQQWTRTFEDELTSGLLFHWAKTAAEIDGGISHKFRIAFFHDFFNRITKRNVFIHKKLKNLYQ